MRFKCLLIFSLLLIVMLLIPVSFANNTAIDGLSNQSSTDLELVNDYDVSILDSKDDSLLSDFGSVGGDLSDLNDDSLLSDFGSVGGDLSDSNLNNNLIINSNSTLTGSDIPSADLNSSFADLSLNLTGNNTIYVNASYTGSIELGTQKNPYKSLNSSTIVEILDKFEDKYNSTNDIIIKSSYKNLYISNGLYHVSNRISLNKTINVLGESYEKTILSGNNADGLFLINNIAMVNFINLTFINASSSSLSNEYYGGAIYNSQTSSINIMNCIFRNNLANGLFSQDYNNSGAGGAIYNDGGSLKIFNSSFINNSASDGNVSGGAIYNNMGDLVILNSNFINNSLNGDSASGGAIYQYNGYLTIFNSSFLNNRINANYSLGGAVCTWSNYNFYLINSTVNNNSIYGKFSFGSAIANNGVLFEIINSTISNNLANGTSTENGTVYNLKGFYYELNSTIENNTLINPKNQMLAVLEDQLIIDNPFSQDLLDDLPSSYDLRNSSLVTSVKEQGSSGSCWAFAAYASLESYLLKYENISYDLSENNLKNLMNVFGENGTDWDDGGCYQMFASYLLRWSGPIYETDDPYDSGTEISEELNPIKHVQDILYLPISLNLTDNNQIKYAIMKYGALFTAICFNAQSNPNYYSDVRSSTNHAVAIVGWDDNYSLNNFKSVNGVKPAGDGAFIVKNSWGNKSGENGYFYISYYDMTFIGHSFSTASVIAFSNVENTTNYKDIYQYDPIGNTFTSVGYHNETAWFANQFTATSDNPLNAVGFYTYGNSSYLINIYVNGNLVHSENGNLSGAGYHTVKLNKFIPLNKGDLFKVEIKLTTPSSLFPIAIESNYAGYSSKVTANLNQSFISADGEVWYDIAQNTSVIKFFKYPENYTLNNTNVCLKAYVSYVGDLILNISSNASDFVIGDLIQITLNLTNGGEILDNINLSSVMDDTISIVSYDLTKGSFNKDNGIWSISTLDSNESAILRLTLLMNMNKNIQLKFNIDTTGLNINKNVYYLNLTARKVDASIINISHSGDDNKDIQLALDSAKYGDIINLGDNYNYTNLNHINITKDLTIISGVNTSISRAIGADCIFYIPSISNGGPVNVTFSNLVFNVSCLLNNQTETNNSSSDFNSSNNNAFNKFAVVLTEAETLSTKLSNIAEINIINNTFYSLNPSSLAVLCVESDTLNFKPINSIKISNNTLVSGMKSFVISLINSTNDSSVIIPKYDKIATVLSVSKVMLNESKVILILKDIYGNPISNEEISYIVNFNNKTSFTQNLTTNSEGSVEINGMNQDALVDFLFLGSDIYNASNASINFINYLSKITIINFNNMTSYAVLKSGDRTGKYFEVNLTNYEGNPLANKTIQIGFNGKVYARTTNSSGGARLQVNLAYSGGYTFAIAFLGDGDYESSFAVAKITVVKNPTKFTLKNYTFKSTAKTKKIQASLKTSSGKLVVNRTVKFTVNGKTYSSKTNSKGVATVSISLSTKKTFTYSVSFAGDSQCKATSSKAKIIIS